MAASEQHERRRSQHLRRNSEQFRSHASSTLLGRHKKKEANQQASEKDKGIDYRLSTQKTEI